MARPIREEKRKATPEIPRRNAIEVMATVIEPLPNAMFRVEAGKQAPSPGARFRQDAQEFHPDFGGRQGRGGALALRLTARRIVYRYK